MKRDERGIERAREMRRWKGRRGGHAPAPDLFQTHEAGAYDSSCLDWFASLRLRNLSPATIETYRWALLRYRKWLLAHHQGSYKRISSLLTADHVDSFHHHLIVEQATARTRGYLLANLKRLSHWLTANAKLQRDPLLNIETPKVPKVHLPTYLPLSTIALLLELPDISDPLGIRDRAILEVFYSTGLRRKELSCLALQDLDHHQRTIQVRFGKGGIPRIVPAGSRAFEWIRAYLTKTRPLLTDVSTPESPLFVTGYDDAFSPGSIGHLIRDYLDLAGFHHPGACHLFRHSCATHLMDGGAGLRAIQRILGHSRLDTTAIYTHVSNQKLLEVHAKCHPHGDQASPPQQPPTSCGLDDQID